MVFGYFFLFFSLVFSLSVKETRNPKEVSEFYSKIQEFDLKVKKYENLGFGLEIQKSINPGEPILCLPFDVVIYHSDKFALSDYIKDLSPVEKLVCRILYEKFLGKSKNFYNIYINSLPNEFSSATFWSNQELELFTRYNLIKDFEKYFNRVKDHEKVVKRIKNLIGVPEEMLKYESYIWALETVLSRAISFKNAEGAEIYMLVPYIDVTNHWPNPLNFTGTSVQIYEKELCLLSGWHFSKGDQVFADYGRYESAYFFFKYQFNIENPYDFMVYTYKELKTKTYQLSSHQLNVELLHALISQNQENYINTISINDLNEFFNGRITKETAVEVLFGLYKYKFQYLDKTKFENSHGIREARRYLIKSKNEEKIMNFAIGLRKAIYNHLRIIDRKILFTLSKLIFS